MSAAFDRKQLDIATALHFRTFIHRTFQEVAPGQIYVPNYHIDAMAYELDQCRVGGTRRLLINLPPRSLKSICASVAFVAWYLGHYPDCRVICLSYSAELAARNAYQRRAVMESDWYRRAYPNTRISRDKNTEMYFMTTRQGFCYSTSVGGTLTGIGGNLIVIDDPISAGDALSEARRTSTNEWFDSTVYSRLDDKLKGIIIIASQRLHIDDLSGHVLRHGSWNQLKLPAIAEDDTRIQIGPEKFYLRRAGELLQEAREPMKVLDALKEQLGSFRFSAQYQQCPTPVEGEIVKWEWFERYDELPPRAPGDMIVQSWDTASKAEELSDYSVCTTWQVHGSDYYLIDLTREKLGYPSLKRRVVELARMFNADSVIIEDKGSGISLIQDLRSGDEGAPYPIEFTPEGDKVTRMSTQSAKIEARHVFLPRRAEWLDDFRTELLQFPHGRHDDQIDSISQFLNWIDQRQRNRVWVTDFPF